MNTTNVTIRVKDIIDRIQQMGYRVKLTHHRYFGTKLLKNSDIRVLVKAMNIMSDGSNKAGLRSYGELINPRGGLTTVEVTDWKQDDGNGHKKFEARAECSLSDVFTYAKAGRLALYRVLKQIPDLSPSLANLKNELESQCVVYQVQEKKDNYWRCFQIYTKNEPAKQLAEQLRSMNRRETRVVEVFE